MMRLFRWCVKIFDRLFERRNYELEFDNYEDVMMFVVETGKTCVINFEPSTGKWKVVRVCR